jgi:hypothetical protein
VLALAYLTLRYAVLQRNRDRLGVVPPAASCLLHRARDLVRLLASGTRSKHYRCIKTLRGIAMSVMRGRAGTAAAVP